MKITDRNVKHIRLFIAVYNIPRWWHLKGVVFVVRPLFTFNIKTWTWGTCRWEKTSTTI